ncbi:PI-PLC X domain-containing protein 1 [Bactrocera neohumeralis]|uniref:PI-PLC X domain-containing protein 1 n=1 Tax=Bactrocera neohumeralis TaxID=98809 RepID=UPI0021669EF7|nr:PI-PLC X domain-containing protein 1 [Bactrocera neohumeralis]XP_050319001.1 PI-PLC X domain-containing protein 1 [Bactrocera neohumeralis]XP_050319002.1 PI-PLC X domain-containing protein 1 [Bactrocera neohumeralis]
MSAIKVCEALVGLYIYALCGLSTVSALPYNYDDIHDLSATRPDAQPKQLRLWLTISARHRFLEVSWTNAPAHKDDHILITMQAPHKFERVELTTGTPLAAFDNAEGSGFVPNDGVTERSTSSPTRYLLERENKHNYVARSNASDTFEGSGFVDTYNAAPPTASMPPRLYWISNNGSGDIVAALQPSAAAQWFTTGVYFDYGLSRNVTAKTGCYGFWASYVNASGDILATSCLRAYPRWMREMRAQVGGMRMRDLFIPGTHDSGSYRPNFDPLLRETIVTKYALTQDDDIRGQLLHGVRYLDIRVGYYRNTPERFYINHGVTRQRPLAEIIEQVKEFVLETNEIVIFGLKEFPVGFGKGLGVHRLLVSFLQQQFGDVIVHPSASWRATLNDIWSRQQNVILAYDKGQVVAEFPNTLFRSVEQRWGNVQTWPKLEKYLRSINNFDVSRLSSRPIADMAELTPDTWGVILDKYGGLRKMADQVNWRISELYRDELGANANIVAVDFIRGTSLMDIALEWNKRKVVYY